MCYLVLPNYHSYLNISHMYRHIYQCKLFNLSGHITLIWLEILWISYEVLKYLSSFLRKKGLFHLDNVHSIIYSKVFMSWWIHSRMLSIKPAEYFSNIENYALCHKKWFRLQFMSTSIHEHYHKMENWRLFYLVFFVLPVFFVWSFFLTWTKTVNIFLSNIENCNYENSYKIGLSRIVFTASTSLSVT